VFRLPGPLRRALGSRIGTINQIIDAVAARHPVGVVDLDGVAGIYHAATWSVDRLHPSELGHRMLAREFARMLSDRGAMVRGEVSLVCAGGAATTRLHHMAWLIVKGIPWLVRRGRDLMGYGAAIVLRAAWPANRGTGAPTYVIAEAGRAAGPAGLRAGPSAPVSP
jgi:hypothetical protein